MRGTIKIVGVGQRRTGISKTGKNYDFTPVSFCYTDSRITGYGAATCNVAQDCLGDYAPKVNDEKEAVFHQDFKSGTFYIDAII